MRYFLLTILCALLLLSTQLGEEVHATVKAPTVKVVSVTKTFTRTFSKTSTRTSTSSRTPTATKTATITRTPSRTLTSTVTPSKTFTITRTPSRTPPPTRTVAPEVVPDVIVKGYRSVFVYSGDICFGKKVGSLSNIIGVIQQNIGWIGIYDGACFMSGQGWYEVFLYTRVRGLIYTTEFLPVWVATSTPTATKTSTSTSTPSATLTPSNTPTLTPTSTHTSTPTATNTNTPTVTFSPTSTNTPTHTATNTPTVTNTPTITVIPSINWVIDETGTFELEMSEGSRCYVKNIVGYPTSWVLIEFTGDMLGSPVVAQDVKCTEDESSTIDIYNFLIRNGYTVNEIKALP